MSKDTVRLMSKKERAATINEQKIWSARFAKENKRIRGLMEQIEKNKVAYKKCRQTVGDEYLSRKQASDEFLIIRNEISTANRQLLIIFIWQAAFTILWIFLR